MSHHADATRLPTLSPAQQRARRGGDLRGINDVIISARNLTKYFPTLQFPVTVLEERSDRIALTVGRDELLSLITRDKVIGVGSWRAIKRLRLNSPMRSEEARGEQVDPWHGGDSRRVHYDEDLGQGHHMVMLKRHCHHTGQWHEWDQALTFDELRAGRMISQETARRRASR